MFRNLALKSSTATLACATIYLCRNVFEEKKPHLAATAPHNFTRRFYPSNAEYPNLSKHRNMMARCLRPDMYAKLRDRLTTNGFTIDDVIQTGVDNMGRYSSIGLVAGDEESYKVYNELFDEVIEMKHKYAPNQVHKKDLDSKKIQNGLLDQDYVLSVRFKALRNLRGFSLPSFCTRGERREIESIVCKTMLELKENESEYEGIYFSLPNLTKTDDQFLELLNFSIERPFMPAETSAGLARDWPDARGIFINKTRELAAYINRKDHVTLTFISKTSDLSESFRKFVSFLIAFENRLNKNNVVLMENEHLGYLTTSPEHLGTALKISAHVKLPLLSKNPRLPALLKMLELNTAYKYIKEQNKPDEDDNDDDDDLDDLNDLNNFQKNSSPIVELSSNLTLGITEVETTQKFINSIRKLVEIEKGLTNGKEIADLI